jgi:flagellar motor switch protein FliN/FliY
METAVVEQIAAPGSMTVLEEIATLADVPMEIEIELDRRVIKLDEVLDWQPGSLLTLSKAAGEPLDIVIGGQRVGSGEMEVLYETVGLRLSIFAS